MATKGYPRTRFRIFDQTQIPEITVTAQPNPTAVIMTAFTSDKGPENWQLLYGLSDFTKVFGGISFLKHGQAQLMAAEVLRNGGYILGKRMVSSNATIGNATVHARVIVSEGVSFVYLYATSATAAGNLEDAAEAGYGSFNLDAEGVNDFPLFTITASGRGASNIFFRITPEYSASRTSTYLRYTFEVYEAQELIESFVFTMNPDVIIDSTSQSLESKIKSNSRQVDCKLFEDGIYGLVRKLAATATVNNSAVNINTLVDLDFINGCDRRGNTLGNVVAKAATSGTDLWTTNMPSGITAVHLNDALGIPLSNGSYGTSGSTPVQNLNEYTNLLLGAWGHNKTSEQYNPVIYDLDAYKPDAVFDCGYPVSVKNAIIDVCDFRNDMMFFADLVQYNTLGTTCKDASSIVAAAGDIMPSRNCAKYHNYFKVINPYTKKEITVTMPYLLANRMVGHVSKGINRAFAGMANNMKFPEIIPGSINFLPVTVPEEDQKQTLVNASVNYLSLYDGVPVMETMYNNAEEYTQLTYIHNVLATQEVIKAIRSRCPLTRYTPLSSKSLEDYITDAEAVIKQFATNFESISIKYLADEQYEANNIFYAALTVRYRNFIQEEVYNVYAISNQAT